MRVGCWAAKPHLNALRQFSIQTGFTQSDSWAGSHMWHDERSQGLFQGVGPEFQPFLLKRNPKTFFYYYFVMHESDVCFRERKLELQIERNRAGD